jgi:gliding motility-associated-like protein
MLEMNVSNTTPGSEIRYKLYLAPDFVSHIAETMAPSFVTLQAGVYRVRATQTLGFQFNIEEVDVEIEDLVEKLDFELSDSAALDCNETATLTVTVLAGNPTFYEIISGPVTRPLQASNQFTNLSSGTYTVRVFDDCNDALTKAYTFAIGNNNFSIGAPSFPEVASSCSSTTIVNKISSNTAAPIVYPLTVNYTVFAPDGSVAQSISQIITTGDPISFELSQNIPLFGNQLFLVNIEVSDNCSNVFSGQFEIDPSPKLIMLEETAECGELFFSIAVSNFSPPFSLNIMGPSGFNPALFNINYPGPFLTSPVLFGSEDNTVPFGDYTAAVQDACGRIKQLEFSFIKKPLQPSVVASNNGCGSAFGTVRITIPDDRFIVAINLTEAPMAYTNPLPQNMMSFVNANGVFIHPSLPVGEYTFFITDSCGDSYTVAVIVPAFVLGQLAATTRPDCNPTTGAVRLSTSNGIIVTMKIIAAPQNTGFVLPYDVSANINSNGVFFMGDLPAGMYTFEARDNCGFNLQISVEIFGYTRTSDGFEINRKCGSFDITMGDTDASITGKRFWLQKYYPETSTWGHPYTDVSYLEGTIPNTTTASELINNATVLNIFLIGDFRVIKVFDSYDNGNQNAQCSDLYVEFSIAPELAILGAYNLSCDDGIGPNNVVIDVEGVAPFNFTMTEPVVLDNGTNNTFVNLTNGSYNFKVTDDCGNIKNVPVEIGTLLPLVRAIAPQSMLVCRTDGVPFGIFPLVNQTPQILGNQSPNTYNVTYHLTQFDANNGLNPLPDGYTNISNPQTIYARVEHKTLPLCYATTSFPIFTGVTPQLSPALPIFLCVGFSKTLTAEAGFAMYLWSTGETTQSITIQTAGTYSVTVSNVYQDLTCDATKDFVVTSSSEAVIQTIDISDWTEQNKVVISVNGSGTYLYSLDNLNFQSSNTFYNLPAGEYTVYVKDDNGCGTANQDFVLLNYPKFFTPNGDGYNDTWHVQFSKFEPNLSVDIFDRYGKLVKRLNSGDAGWDGTLNGFELPSTDYWFVITRQDGRVYKGHFSLKR